MHIVIYTHSTGDRIPSKVTAARKRAESLTYRTMYLWSSNCYPDTSWQLDQRWDHEQCSSRSGEQVKCWLLRMDSRNNNTNRPDKSRLIRVTTTWFYLGLEKTAKYSRTVLSDPLHKVRGLITDKYLVLMSWNCPGKPILFQRYRDANTCRRQPLDNCTDIIQREDNNLLRQFATAWSQTAEEALHATGECKWHTMGLSIIR